jgi:cell division protein FtsZ
MTEAINFTPDYSAKENTSDIKVIGVGGGGSNAVQHMYAEGIQGVDYLVCNTDKCHLDACKIQEKLLLGNGLGAGANPEVAHEYASKKEDEIRKFIGENTKMLFIAAGMGKGTGTGASPVVAKVAKEMGILTVGVVTEPFKFEGKRRLAAAKSGIEEMNKYVDSLIIVNNQNLMKYYNTLAIDEAYAQVDDVLKNAVKCIAEIITVTYGQNVDFNDVKTIMQDSGKAMLGIATAEGENRVEQVLDEVLNCPLLENADISNAKNLLFFVTYGSSKKITMGELEVLQERFDEMQSDNVHLIWGHGLDESLGDKLKLSLVVTNFDTSSEEEIIIDSTGEKQIINTSIDEAPNIGEDIQVKTTIEEPKVQEVAQPVVEEEPVVVMENKTEEPIPSPFESEPFTLPVENRSTFSSNSPFPINATQPNDDYNSDDIFINMVNTPAIKRTDIFASQSMTQTKVEEANNEVYFELHDDVKDIFHGLAD